MTNFIRDNSGKILQITMKNRVIPMVEDQPTNTAISGAYTHAEMEFALNLLTQEHDCVQFYVRPFPSDGPQTYELFIGQTSYTPWQSVLSLFTID